MSTPSQPYYHAGSPLEVRFNRFMGLLARHGLSLAGMSELSVRGRVSGRIQRLPVNPHTFEGTPYLVSARGHSQWVRNMRAAGRGELRSGRKVRPFTAVEVPDEEKVSILRTYLARWGWEVNRFFSGVTAKSTDAEIAAVAHDHPVFRITFDKGR